MNIKYVLVFILFFFHTLQIKSQNSVLLKDIIPGNRFSSSNNYTEFKNAVYFSVSGFPPGLWKTDGTMVETAQIKEGSAFPGKGNVFSIAEEKFFFFGSGNEPNNSGLWVSDGTEVGTKFLKDFYINSGEFTVLGNELFFRGDDGTGFGFWKSDGTVSGTTKLVDMPQSPSGGFAYPIEIQKVGDRVFFLSGDTNKPNKLWISDGTKTGTGVLIDFGSNEASIWNIALYNDKFLLSIISRSGPNTAYPDLYISDGTDNGTQVISKVNSSFYVFKNEVYFSGIENDSFYLSKYNHVDNQVTKLIPKGLLEFKIWDFEELDEKLFFACDMRWAVNFYRDGIWFTDGTIGGTQQVASQKFELESREIFRYKDRIYFSGTGVNSNDKRQLWRTDGTEEGTELFKILVSGEEGEPGGFRTIGNNLFFTAVKSNLDVHVFWISDGTEQGTFPISGRANKILTNLSDGIIYLSGKDERGFLGTNFLFYYDIAMDTSYNLAPINAESELVRNNFHWIEFENKFIFTAAFYSSFGVEPYIFNPDISSSIKKLEIENSHVLVFPQPFSSSFTIELNESNSNIIEVEFFDLNGSLIKRQSCNQKRIVISDLHRRGMFFAKIYLSNNKIISKRIISID